MRVMSGFVIDRAVAIYHFTFLMTSAGSRDPQSKVVHLQNHIVSIYLIQEYTPPPNYGGGVPTNEQTELDGLTDVEKVHQRCYQPECCRTPQYWIIRQPMSDEVSPEHDQKKDVQCDCYNF